jgi:hypothetical protein
MQRKVGRPTIRTPENRERILHLLANGLDYGAAANALGISYSSFWQWRRDEPEFDQACEHVRAQRADELFERLCNTLFPLGDNEVDLSRPNLVIFALKALDRRRFDDAVAARYMVQRDAALAASMPSEELQRRKARILELLEKAHLIGLARWDKHRR